MNLEGTCGKGYGANACSYIFVSEADIVRHNGMLHQGYGKIAKLLDKHD